MLNRRITALILSILVIFASASAAFAADPTAVMPDEINQPFNFTISGSTIQYPGSRVTVTVHNPDSATFDPAQALETQCVFIGQTAVQADNTYTIDLRLDADADSGNYTYSVYVTGDSAPFVGTFPFSNKTKAGAVLAVVQDPTKTASDVRTILNADIKHVDMESRTSYDTYSDGEKLYVSAGLKVAPAADLNELILDLKAEVNKINKVREIVAAIGDRATIKDLIEDNSTVYLISSDSMTEFAGMDADTLQGKTIVELEKLLPGSLYPEDIRDKFSQAMIAAKTPPTTTPENSTPEDGPVADVTVGGGGITGEMVTDKPTDPNASQASAPATDFSDIDDVEWAKTAIQVLSDKGIVNGKGDGKFCPNDNLTREELVKLLVSGFEMKTFSETALPFKDTKFGEWYYSYLTIAYQLKVTNGVSETSFGVGQPVTRQDMAVFMQKALTAMGKSYADKEYTHTFADDDKIADYAKDAVKMFAGEGVLNGTGNNMFEPTGLATRAEAAKVLYSLLKHFNIL